jgi:hypothetical protein
MSTRSVLSRPCGFFALGPVVGSDWCVVVDPPVELVAPGGLVLCRSGTLEPHVDAQRAAESAWAVLRRWAEHGGRRPGDQ